MLAINKKYFVFASNGNFRKISTLGKLYKEQFKTELLPTDYQGNQKRAEMGIWIKNCEGIEFFTTDMDKSEMVHKWIIEFSNLMDRIDDPDNVSKEVRQIAKQEVDKAFKTLETGL